MVRDRCRRPLPLRAITYGRLPPQPPMTAYALRAARTAG
jgi:hypothetical protein